MTYFNTDPKWLTEIAVWASMIEDISEIWLFGSRATGRRREKDGDEGPDLDLAVVVNGADMGERLVTWIAERDLWAEQVQPLVPVKVDLQFCDFASDDKVPTWVRADGVRIYSRAGVGA